VSDKIQALDKWTALLGADNARTEPETIARYVRTTQDTAPVPLCVLYPESTEDVREIVRIAGEHAIPVYPISRGRNWGYGDACAPVPGSAIIDMARMNRIHEVNSELAYAVIEPGVTQGQLYEYLEKNNTGLWMDSTGAGPESSLTGNTLDRGFGHTRYGDHFESCCGMEAVLADGRVLNTGFGHYKNAKAGRVFRYGIGPFLDGIFCQSNIGIVTKIGIWLTPRPEDFCFFFCTLPDKKDLPVVIDRLRPLKLQGLLNSAIHIANDLRLLSSRRHFPWDEAPDADVISPDLLSKYRKIYEMGEWNVAGAITGSRAQVRDVKRRLRRALKPLGWLAFVGDRKLALGECAARILSRFGYNKLSEQLSVMKPVYEQSKGKPADASLFGTMWRVRNPPAVLPGDRDLHDTNAGLMWLSPVLPAKGRDAVRVMEIAQKVFDEYRFDLLATFTMLNERCLVGILNMSFDKTMPEETQRAMACYDAAMQALIEEGYIPYRTGLRGMAKVRSNDDVFWQVASDIKKALDPGDIIARGRYIDLL